LNVIPEPVDEEIGARIHAANDELVAVTLPLVHINAWNVARDVREILEACV
jgi:hypothetical protein